MKENTTEAAQETGNLIASEKVEGTNIYNAAGDNLGAVHDLMIDKATRKVAYALISFGGFLGIGNQYHPLPWSFLKNDTNVAGYVSISTKGSWKAVPHTTSAPNQRGAIALTKAIYTTISESDPTGLCDITARIKRWRPFFLCLRPEANES
jgi:hypothetical protein